MSKRKVDLLFTSYTQETLTNAKRIIAQHNPSPFSIAYYAAVRKLFETMCVEIFGSNRSYVFVVHISILLAVRNTC